MYNYRLHVSNNTFLLKQREEYSHQKSKNHRNCNYHNQVNSLHNFHIYLKIVYGDIFYCIAHQLSYIQIYKFHILINLHKSNNFKSITHRQQIQSKNNQNPIYKILIIQQNYNFLILLYSNIHQHIYNLLHNHQINIDINQNIYCNQRHNFCKFFHLIHKIYLFHRNLRKFYLLSSRNLNNMNYKLIKYHIFNNFIDIKYKFLHEEYIPNFKYIKQIIHLYHIKHYLLDNINH